MPEQSAPSPLRDHLENQLRSAYRALEKATEGLTIAQAFEGARPDWRRYRWGTGLDGSIAGIVHHAALWKQIFARGLEIGAFPGEHDVTPPGVDWPALCQWLAEGQACLERVLAPLSDAALAEEREWEGERAPLARLFTLLTEHDAYHAGQIELMRQLRGYPRGEG